MNNFLKHFIKNFCIYFGTKKIIKDKIMKKKLLFLLFFITFIFFSCNKSDSPNSPTNVNPPTSNQSGQPIPTFAGVIDGVLATIQFDFTIQSPFPVPPITYKMGFASFNNKDAGTVKVNSTVIEKNQVGSALYYSSFSPTNPNDLTSVNFNGSAHNWEVTGSADVPAFTGSVTSPSTFTLITPTANATIKKSDGLTIQWTGTSSADSVLIVAVATNNSGYVVKQGVSNSGSYTISASELGNMNGSTLVQVVKYRFSIKNVGTKNFVLVSEVVKAVTVTLN